MKAAPTSSGYICSRQAPTTYILRSPLSFPIRLFFASLWYQAHRIHISCRGWDYALFGWGDLTTVIPLCLTCFTRCSPSFTGAFNGVFPEFPLYRFAPCVSFMLGWKSHCQDLPDSRFRAHPGFPEPFTVTELLPSAIPSPSSGVRTLIKGAPRAIQ